MSTEKTCEDIEIALLQGQASLASFVILNFDGDDKIGRDRIVVKAEPAQPALKAASGLAVRQWMVPVGVTVHLVTQPVATMQTAIAAILAANNVGPVNAAAAAAGAAFNGWRIEDQPDGERETEDTLRAYTQRFSFYVALT